MQYQSDVMKLLRLLLRRKYKGVNSIEAMRIVGSSRVAARKRDLVTMGYKITSEFEWYGNTRGARWILRGRKK